MVMAIGGADMPVVVSMLNSYSGWAAAATGFMLVQRPADRDRGAWSVPVGAILSYIMCQAMNRNFISVIAGGFGSAPAAPGRAARLQPGGRSGGGRMRLRPPSCCVSAKSVIIVPGYGMAVAQAQHTVYEITTTAAREGASMCALASTRWPVACRAT
jgi:NAD(P) transhydrogenase subunit beta